MQYIIIIDMVMKKPWGKPGRISHVHYSVPPDVISSMESLLWGHKTRAITYVTPTSAYKCSNRHTTTLCAPKLSSAYDTKFTNQGIGDASLLPKRESFDHLGWYVMWSMPGIDCHWIEDKQWESQNQRYQETARKYQWSDLSLVTRCTYFANNYNPGRGKIVWHK